MPGLNKKSNVEIPDPLDSIYRPEQFFTCFGIMNQITDSSK